MKRTRRNPRIVNEQEGWQNGESAKNTDSNAHDRLESRSEYYTVRKRVSWGCSIYG